MKNLLLFLLLPVSIGCHAQEMDSDLFATLKSSALHIFHNSDKTKMEIVTYRNSDKNELLEETSTIYRKGKINANRISFNIKYSEHYVLADRKKSMGKYEFNEKGQIMRYERTDFNEKNMRTYSFHHFYHYEQDVVRRENIRIKEYGYGSVEVDTTVYLDSMVYVIEKNNNQYIQKDQAAGGATMKYTVENDRLVQRSNFLEGFEERVVYIYDQKNHLVKIEKSIIGEDNKSLTNHTIIHYDISGLIDKVEFFDDQQVLLEQKLFTYK